MVHQINQKPVIIFDLDGTLISTDDRWYALHEFFATKYGQAPVERTAYLEAKKNNMPEEEIVQQFSHETIQPYLEDRLEHIEDAEFLDKDSLKPGAMDVLNTLSDQYDLTLLTRRKHLMPLTKELERLGIAHFFDNVYVSREKTIKIPEIIEDYGKIPSYLIGDTEDDYKAAKQNDIPCILISDGSRTHAFLSSLKPTFLFDTISKVQSVL